MCENQLYLKIMSYLLAKSNDSIESAVILHDSKKYASSVHCSYYSCLQFMYHLIHTVLGENDETLLNKCKTRAEGSHELVFGEIKLYMYANSKNDSEAQVFGKRFATLKRNRVAADYLQEEILPVKSNASIELSKQLVATLLKNFK